MLFSFTVNVLMLESEYDRIVNMIVGIVVTHVGLHQHARSSPD
jgi:hypothetical protein